MKQYISKSALVVEIEKRKGMCDNHYGDYWNGCYNTFTDILSFIDTLEVKEVDLEEEVKRYDMSKIPYSFKSTVEFAKHFFELGMQVSNKA